MTKETNKKEEELANTEPVKEEVDSEKKEGFVTRMKGKLKSDKVKSAAKTAGRFVLNFVGGVAGGLVGAGIYMGSHQYDQDDIGLDGPEEEFEETE